MKLVALHDKNVQDRLQQGPRHGMYTSPKTEDDNDCAKAMEARGLLLPIKGFKFVLSLVVFDRLLSCSKGLSNVLQSTQLDLAKAGDLVSALISI